MFEIKRYTQNLSEQWDSYVSRSKNGTFLFKRDYMDYHSHRFEDLSWLVYLENKLYAVLPANRIEETLYTHQGLTYGGLVMDSHVTAARILTLFTELNTYLKVQSISTVYYKSIPYIYKAQPSEEDLYAIFRTTNAHLAARDVGTVIHLQHPLPWYRIRERGMKRALQAGVVVQQTNNFAPFWKILTQNLQTRYSVSPVHSLQEIELLHKRFPNNILHYTASREGEVLAGVVLYLTPHVVHVQYIASGQEGKALGALDLLFHQLITKEFAGYQYFDFGRSTEKEGTYLNESLIFQKEGFGGRAVCWDQYKWTL